MDYRLSALLIIGITLLMLGLFVGVCIYILCTDNTKAVHLLEFMSKGEKSEGKETVPACNDPEDKTRVEARAKNETAEETSAAENKGETNLAGEEKIVSKQLLEEVKNFLPLIENKKEVIDERVVVIALTEKLTDERRETYGILLNEDAEFIGEKINKPCQLMAISETEKVKLLVLDADDLNYVAGILVTQGVKLTYIKQS